MQEKDRRENADIYPGKGQSREHHCILVVCCCWNMSSRGRCDRLWEQWPMYLGVFGKTQCTLGWVARLNVPWGGWHGPMYLGMAGTAQYTLGWVARPNVPGGEGKGNMKSAKNVRVVFRKPSYINKNHCYLKGIYRRFMRLCKFCIMLQFCCIVLLKCCKKPAYGPGGMPSALSRHTYSCKCKFSSRGFADVPHGK